MIDPHKGALSVAHAICTAALALVPYMIIIGVPLTATFYASGGPRSAYEWAWLSLLVVTATYWVFASESPHQSHVSWNRKRLRMMANVLAGTAVGTAQAKLLFHHPIANGIVTGTIVWLVMAWTNANRRSTPVETRKHSDIKPDNSKDLDP